MDRKAAIRTRSQSLINGSNSGTTTAGSTGTRTRHKSGNASYADLITRAVLSSEEKRLTLSEIYDWMVDNVPGLKDQRYLHSAKGWKVGVTVVDFWLWWVIENFVDLRLISLLVTGD